jgi:uncharacterized protein with PIN domain
MGIAWFRFYEELNDFLPTDKKKVRFSHVLYGRNAVKDTIEALGVPHPEVDLILANGRSVDFSYIVQDGDFISVYPVFETLDITPLVRLRPKPLRTTRFVVDVHLGRLARYLRMLGFDTLYSKDYDDEELACLACEERRILLTRDRGLLKRRIVSHGYWVRETDPWSQLREIFARLDLYASVRSFQRCIRCNSLLAQVTKKQIQGRLEPDTLRYYEQFWICKGCRQIYWEGSHYLRMQRLVQELLQKRPEAPFSGVAVNSEDAE